MVHQPGLNPEHFPAIHGMHFETTCKRRRAGASAFEQKNLAMLPDNRDRRGEDPFVSPGRRGRGADYESPKGTCVIV